MKKPIIMEKVKGALMKKMVSIMLILLLLFPVTVLAAGYDSLVATIDGKKTKLTIEDHGYSEDHKKYTVTVGGYNVLLSGKFGNISDLMPFKVSIAWNEDEYITGSNYAVTTEPVTIVVFEDEVGFPEEEPLYIIITQKNKSVRSIYSYYYIVSEEKFHDAEDVIGTPAPTATPKPTPEPTPTAAPTPEPTSAPVEVGEVINFGKYEQDYDTANGPEEIEWLVLAIEGDKALVISRYALDYQRYNESYTSVTWETCTLRTWLNDTFLNTAFTAEEQRRIPIVTVSADENPRFTSDPGNSTKDRVFLLSITEAEKYFPSKTDRQCEHTAAAAVRVNIASNGNCNWWLRSPGSSNRGVAIVDRDGLFSYHGGSDVSTLGVRPALWIHLGSQ